MNARAFGLCPRRKGGVGDVNSWFGAIRAGGRLSQSIGRSMTEGIARTRHHEAVHPVPPGEPGCLRPVMLLLREHAVPGWITARFCCPVPLLDYQQGALPLGRAVHPQKGPAQPFALDFRELRRHVAVIGPGGSGKTRNVLVPWTVGSLFDDLSVVVVDVKGDYGKEVRDYRHAQGIAGSRAAFLWDVNEPVRSRPRLKPFGYPDDPGHKPSDGPKRVHDAEH